MGIGVRVFFVDGRDVIRKIPYTRFERLWDQHPEECFPEYAGTRTRCAIAYVNLENRTPVDISHLEFLIIPFGKDGRINSIEFDRGMALAIQTLGSLKPDAENVTAAEHLFARRRYHHEFKWTPTAEQKSAVISAALNAKRLR
jgi:hypothetical protein